MPTEPTAEVQAEEFELRPGLPADLPSVHEIFLATSALPGQPVEKRSPEQVREWALSLLERPGRELWVACRGEELLGFVLLENSWVNLIFVHPERPARGVGGALMELVKSLRPGGFGLRVLQDNARAQSFYRRHGLIELESTDGSTYADESPDLQMAWLGSDPLTFLRGRIDAVDDELAVLLARRAALTGAVQDVKAATGGQGGERGRDAQREAEIVDRMARHVPQLGPDQIARVMHTVIEESLAAWEQDQS